MSQSLYVQIIVFISNTLFEHPDYRDTPSFNFEIGKTL